MKKRNFDLNFYKIIWLFILGSFIGWIVELLVYWIKYGKFMYFQGLVYGPFQPIYGLGVVILAIIFSFYKKKKVLMSFLIGFFFFGIFEYFSSWFQEFFFGSYTWNYIGFFQVNLNGRVNLLYCVFFGLVAVIWARYVHERLLKFLERFNKGKWKYVTLVLTIFLVINVFLTCAVTKRKVDRFYEKPAQNSLERFVDKYYDNEFMQKWLPKVRVVK